MYIFDEDSANTVKAEERQYQAWERTEKNRILAMSSTEKKQAAWRLLFPQVESSDDYLNGLIY